MIIKYFFKVVWAIWCLPAWLVIVTNYNTVPAKGLDLANIKRYEHEYENRKWLAPIYAIPMWSCIIFFLLGLSVNK